MSDGRSPVAPSWHLLTGEYPPQPGGVSDYTHLLARALRDSGQQVHVWAPEVYLGRTDSTITIHELPGFGPAGLRALSAGLLAVPGPRRLLVQYVASAFGLRGMNLPFVFWLANWAPDEVWVQFHEVAYGFAWRQRPRHNVLAAVEWWMAQLAAGRAERVFVSIPGWRRQLGRHAVRAEVLPIPSNVPVEAEVSEVERLIARLGAGPLVGHFGTYGTWSLKVLHSVVGKILLGARDAQLLLVGRGSLECARTLTAAYPELGPRVVATGALPPKDIACHLAACDVLLQPYPDGISGRRTSAMAGLALGRPMVTTTGHLTEDHWASSAAVKLVPVGEPQLLVSAVLRLLSAPEERAELGRQARLWYEQRFSLAHTLHMLGV